MGRAGVESGLRLEGPVNDGGRPGGMAILYILRMLKWEQIVWGLGVGVFTAVVEVESKVEGVFQLWRWTVC